MEQSQSILKAPEEPKTLPVISEHFVSTKDTCGGAPRIAGSRIRVKDVAIWHIHQGLSPDQIVTPTRTSPPGFDATASM